jgi:HlyD family secretion protein
MPRYCFADIKAGSMAPLLALLLCACSPTPPAGWSGYIEGDYVYVSSALGGTITSLVPRPGEQVAQGAPLFTLDPDAEQAARLQADAQLVHAQAAASNLGKGRRAEELAVLQAQLTQAQAQAQQADSDLAREQLLVTQGFVSAARSEALRTALAAARARVEEIRAQLQVARLPARSDELSAAQADTAAATQQVRQLAWREAQKTRTAPEAARVADSFFRVGEWVAPGQPVVSLLPAANIKVKFFVAQGELPGLQLGTPVQIRCDGCAAPIAARVSFMSSRAEYTPPVIYSNAQRAKLVFLIEARPDARDAEKLKPGQPVDVSLSPGKTP